MMIKANTFRIFALAASVCREPLKIPAVIMPGSVPRPKQSMYKVPFTGSALVADQSRREYTSPQGSHPHRQPSSNPARPRKT